MRGVLCYVDGMTTKHDKALTATWREGYAVGHKDGHGDGKIVASNETLHKTFSDYQKGYGQGVAHALTASSIAIIGGTLIWVLVNA